MESFCMRCQYSHSNPEKDVGILRASLGEGCASPTGLCPALESQCLCQQHMFSLRLLYSPKGSLYSPNGSLCSVLADHLSKLSMLHEQCLQHLKVHCNVCFVVV